MGVLSTVSKGAKGEKYTAKYLRRHRFHIIERNMRNKYSEIDIIAENKEYIVFIEVKTRTGDTAVRPSEAVNTQKQQKIIRAAKYYLAYNYNTKKQPRFDVAEVYLDEKSLKPYRINYIENAYTQGGNYAVF